MSQEKHSIIFLEISKKPGCSRARKFTDAFKGCTVINLSSKILVFHKFNDIYVGQMVSGYIDASALVGNDKLFSYVVDAPNNSYMMLLAGEMGINYRELFFIYRSHYWLHPKLMPHFAHWLGDEYFSFVLDALQYWSRATTDQGDVCGFLRRCYRLEASVPV